MQCMLAALTYSDVSMHGAIKTGFQFGVASCVVFDYDVSMQYSMQAAGEGMKVDNIIRPVEDMEMVLFEMMTQKMMVWS